MENEERSMPDGLAVAFANALVAGDFAAAHGMLTPDLQSRITPEELKEKLFAMFSAYAEGSPERIWFDPNIGLTTDWPDKSAADICWAYVGIEGEDFNEAVSVLVTRLDDKLAIREIEWGRP